MSDRRLLLETRAAKQLRDSLRLITDDEEVIADTIEGETNLELAIQNALHSLGEDEIQQDGLSAYIKKLSERLERTNHRIERKRDAILQAMQAGEKRKLTLPEATISIRDIKPSLDVTDESKIPSQYFVEQKPKLDRAALKADLEAGKAVAGAVMDNGGTGLTIRRK